MTAILQITLSKAYSWMKTFVYFKFHWNGPVDNKSSLARLWLGAALNQWRPSLLTYICVVRLPCVKSKTGSYNYNDVIMSTMTFQITGASIVYSTVCSGADQRKHQSSASLAFVRGIHRWPVNSPHKAPVTRKMFPFDDVIISSL